jgi:hypothetical protein
VFDGTNLGVGVTPSAWGTLKPVQVLNASFSGYANRAYVGANWYYDATFGEKYIASDYATQYLQVSGQHRWLTAASGTAGNTISFTQAMTLDASGNLGIGTTSPDGKFVVLGTAGSNPYSHFKDASGADFFIQSVGNSDCRTGTASNHPWLMFTNGTERARIDSSGNLLVGTTSQINSAKVSVTSGNNVFAASCSIGASGYYNLSQNNNGFVFYAESGTNTFRGSASYNGTGISYNSASDYRLKNVIGQIPNPLETVSALKPCQFVWKETGETDVGFIAHELQEIFPKAVSGEKDAVDAEGNPKYQGIDTSFLVATLTAAIQEQQALITQQAAALTTLTERITALEAK